jgi:hypothetical protein
MNEQHIIFQVVHFVTFALLSPLLEKVLSIYSALVAGKAT